MNNTIQTLLERRSIRNFLDTPIKKEDLDEILKVGTYSPTGHNLQTPIIVVIESQEWKAKIKEANAKIGGWKEGFDPFYGAPTILLVIAKKEPNAIYDGSCVMMNLMNAAWALGIGSCWIHRAKEEMEGELGKEIVSALSLEGEYIGIGHVALGYVKGEIPQAKPRKENWIYHL